MQNTIYWYLSDFIEMPGNNDWLSSREKDILNNLRFLKRRSEWRLGRWTAKNAIQKILSDSEDVNFSEIEILPSDKGAPQLYLKNDMSKFSLSISHRQENAVCVVSKTIKPIGCDLEWLEPRSTLFIEDYFTKDEISFIRNNSTTRDLYANLIWSAKESTSKLLQLGLNLDTRDVYIHNIETAKHCDWKDMHITLKNSVMFYGKWKQISNYILTIVTKTIPVQLVKL